MSHFSRQCSLSLLPTSLCRIELLDHDPLSRTLAAQATDHLQSKKSGGLAACLASGLGNKTRKQDWTPAQASDTMTLAGDAKRDPLVRSQFGLIPSAVLSHGAIPTATVSHGAIPSAVLLYGAKFALFQARFSRTAPFQASQSGAEPIWPDSKRGPLVRCHSNCHSLTRSHSKRGPLVRCHSNCHSLTRSHS